MATDWNLLLSWDAVDQLPDLEHLRMILEALPDKTLLEARRDRGRNDYPVRAMVVCQHPSVEALVRELERNRRCCHSAGSTRWAGRAVAGGRRGSNVVPFGPLRNGMPSAYSRFLRSVSEVEQGLVTDLATALCGDLLAELPGLEALGHDGTALPAHATGRTCPASTVYEIPMAWRLTRASASEVKTLEGMLPARFGAEPELAARCRDLSADRGLDSSPLKEMLWDRWRIRPLIPAPAALAGGATDAATRVGAAAVEHPTRALDPRRADSIVYTEQGEVRCVCPVTVTERPMAFQGFEAGRATLKYRCPAAARGRGLRGPGALPPPRRVHGRPTRADPAGPARPADLHADPAWQPVVAPRLPAPRRPRADQPTDRPRLRPRAALRARPGPHADTHRAEYRRHDGRRARPGPRRPPPAHALAGPALRRYRIAAPTAHPRQPGRDEPGTTTLAP